MAMSGFEGFEKRLELQFHFFGDDPTTGPMGLGLRRLDFDSLQQVLHAVQCSVVSALGNRHVDSYVLSESSLFVYPRKIIIKTCGTTQLLKSVRPLVHHGRRLGLSLSSLRYTRGSFIFPEAQPYPHSSFDEEIAYLQNSLPKHLFFKKASVMPSFSFSHSWHVFTAASHFDHIGIAIAPLLHFPFLFFSNITYLSIHFIKNFTNPFLFIFFYKIILFNK